jgi:hypothetical protein
LEKPQVLLGARTVRVVGHVLDQDRDLEELGEPGSLREERRGKVFKPLNGKGWIRRREVGHDAAIAAAASCGSGPVGQ